MHRKSRAALLFVACLVVPTVIATHSADTHITSRRVYSQDADLTGHLHANEYVQTNESVRFGDNGSVLLGNLTNDTLTDYRTWTLPDQSGVIGVSNAELTPGSVVFAGTGGALSEDNPSLRWDIALRTLVIDGSADGGAHALLAVARNDEAPINLTRNTTSGGTGVLMYNSATTDSNGLFVTLVSPTTGSGAIPNQQFARMDLLAATHDHQNRKGRFVVSLVDSTTSAVERLTVDAGGGVYLRADTNAGFYRNGASAITTNSTMTIASTKALVLSPTSTGSLPTAATGACVYDSTTSQVKCGIGATPSYQAIATLGVANTWSAAQTFAANVETTSGAFVGVGGVSGVAVVNIGSAITASGGQANALRYGPTLTAAANNDELRMSNVGVFTAATGTFTGLALVGHKVDMGNAVKTGTGTITASYALQVSAGTVATTNWALHATGNSYFGSEIEIDGALNHDGTTIGFFGTAPATRFSSISDPSGGTIVDAEARTAINLILDTLDQYGLTQ